MKTKLFLTIVIALVVSSNVLAGNAKKNVFTNLVDTETGYYKEYTVFDSPKMQSPEKRILCVYDTNGVLKERIGYEWKSDKGWVENYKTEYVYDKSDRVSAVAFTKWNKESKSWSKTSDVKTYDEDRVNMTLTVSDSTVEAAADLAIAEIK